MQINAIITGATGMVGEGVLLECLSNSDIKQVLILTRKPYQGHQHAKLKNAVVPDFFKLDGVLDELKGYDACFYCAGVSSAGMNEADYTHITYDTTMHFAEILVKLNPDMIFGHISGSYTDSSEKGKTMWARVKGRTENALMKLPFKKVYNFRPGLMEPTEGQQNIKTFYKVIIWFVPLFRLLMPSQVSTMRQLAQAMINSVLKGYPKQILEVADIKVLAAE